MCVCGRVDLRADEAVSIARVGDCDGSLFVVVDAGGGWSWSQFY